MTSLGTVRYAVGAATLSLSVISLPFASPAHAQQGAEGPHYASLPATATSPAQQRKDLPLGPQPAALESTRTEGVTFGRAVDLAGTPINMASVRTRPSPSGKQGASSGALPRTAFAMPNGLPVAAHALTSGFGMRNDPLLGSRRAHHGVDLAAPAGSPIVATSDGVVSAGGWYGGYGLLVSVDHGNGVQTRYGHMSRLNVAAGQRVQKGDVIGYVGSTGRSTGPHLHYEVRVDGQAVNPASTLSSR